MRTPRTEHEQREERVYITKKRCMSSSHSAFHKTNSLLLMHFKHHRIQAPRLTTPNGQIVTSRGGAAPKPVFINLSAILPSTTASGQIARQQQLSVGNCNHCIAYMYVCSCFWLDEERLRFILEQLVLDSGIKLVGHEMHTYAALFLEVVESSNCVNTCTCSLLIGFET